MVYLLVILSFVGDVPPFFQPPTDFYGAKGSHVIVTAAAEPTQVPANRATLFTITIRGATNPTELKRPLLHDLPEFARRFEIEDVPGTNPVAFAYRLRPRTTEIDRIPRLRFAYYNPAAADGRQFPVTYTDAIPIRVLPPVTEVEPKSTWDVPAIFREPTASRGWDPAGPGWLGGLSVAVLALAAVYVVWWRWRNPDGPRLARVRQTRAVRRVLARLAAASDPAEVADAVHGYLAERFGLTVPSAAPCDVEAALAEAGFEASKLTTAVGLIRRCDAARFGDGSDTPASLAAAGKALVNDWEGLPC
jgi:hypothetical protein